MQAWFYLTPPKPYYPQLCILFLSVATPWKNNNNNNTQQHATGCANGHNMQIPTMLCPFGRGYTFESLTPTFFCSVMPKRSATMLDPFAQLFQHRWGYRARALRVAYKVSWVVFFPRCSAGPNNFGSCCTVNTDATTPKIVGPTMLGVVASVCTQL